MTDNAKDQISVVYDRADFRALYRACRRCRRNAALLLVVLPVVFGILAYTNGARGLDLAFNALPYFMIALIAVAVFYFFTPWNAVRIRRKLGWSEPLTVRLTDDGVATHHPNQDTLFFWSKIHDVVVRGSRMFLFTSPGCAIILPRHCFASEEQFTEWVEHSTRFWQNAKSVTVE